MPLTSTEQARFNMVEQQIRPWDVLDMRVLELLSKVKREQFVPPAQTNLAFMDLEIPLGHGAFMWQPKLEARVLQSLNLSRHNTVLEVGSGSGYFSALLSRLAGHVVSIEIIPELHAFSEKNLSLHGIDNVTLELGDAAQAWAGNYDAIVLTGSVPILSEAFLQSLNIGGRLFAIVGDAPAMKACLVTRIAPDQFEHVTLFETVVVPLKNALQPNRFKF